jgi:hypothetical protein
MLADWGVCAFYSYSYDLNNSNNQPTDDEISPSLQNCIDFMDTDALSDENLMMAGLGRNM